MNNHGDNSIIKYIDVVLHLVTTREKYVYCIVLFITGVVQPGMTCTALDLDI